MATVVPRSARIRCPKLDGSESWLDDEGTCKTTFADIEARWGIPEALATAIMHLRMMPYEDYLKSSHWQTIRRDVWVAQDGKCAACTNGVIRDVHHRHDGYARKGFERDEDVIGVCRPCHEVEHNLLVARLREEQRKHFPPKA